MIAVLEEMPRLVRTARPEIHRKHRLDVRDATPIDELVRAELIRLGGTPCEIETRRALVLRSHSVLPVIAGKKIAAGVAHDRRPELARELEHVAPKATLIRCRMAGFINAAVHTTPHVFDERAEHTTVEGGNDEIAINENASFLHGGVDQEEEEEGFLAAKKHKRH